MTVTDELRKLLTAQLRALTVVARRLTATRRRAARLFPLTASAVGQLDERTIESLDAMVKRFEQLQNGLQDQLFRTLALIEGEDLRDRTRRDVAELMERIGVLASAADWAELAILRNRLAHAYPTDKRRQARVLNDTFKATDLVLAAFERATSRARQHALQRRREEGRSKRPK